jgi:hypothetical protein
MRFLLLCTLALSFALTGCRNTGVLSASDAADATPATADAVPAGTPMTLRLNETLGTEVSDVGDTFTASVAEDLVAETGRVAIPAGTTVYGSVTGLQRSDNVGEQAAIRLAFDRINVGGTTYDFGAEVTDASSERDREGSLAGDAGKGAAAGAVLGLVLGGDLEDAIKGAVLGAGVGTVISLGTGDVDAVLPSGTRMTVRTSQRLDLR